ncbi:hypothetical protein HOD38_05555 [archaeon]|jgi:hypothetical protein|nr:hypothetical protein [archaeon]MBT4397707.1 hypothetical protein [archaeon]MBT4441597.1 hypothetical protein [archaeon]
MPVVGFNFDKFHVERKKPIEAPLNVDTGMKIVEIKQEEIPLSGDQTQTVMRVDYEFSVKYDPKQAEILIEGHLMFLEEKDKLIKMIEEWKKTKKFEPKATQLIMNNVLLRCNIKALLLGQELGLPPHIRLPMIQPADSGKTPSEKKAEEYIG